MASAQPSDSAAPVPTTVPSAGVWEWFWRAAALGAARRRARLTAVRRERLRRAQLAAELGDRAFEPGDPLRAGAALPLALSLYREAAYWALLAHRDGDVQPSIREVFAAARDEVARTGLSAEELTQVRAALIDKTFVETADDRSEVQESDTQLSQSFVRALIEHNAAGEDQVGNLLVQRAWRSGVALLLLVVGLFAAKLGIESAVRGPDLALGKAWRASSQQFACHPKDAECGGTQTSIFFHTEEEDSPWYEVDLGTPQTIARVEVTNRDDCCLERAVPLVVEVSDDRKKWRTVARRADSFREWEGKFAPLKARYVRLRVDRHSILHLAKVSVRPR
jgi:hypothetical protein